MRDIDEQTDVGAVYMRTLVRSQLRLAALVLLVLGVTLGTLPLVFGYLPSSTFRRFVGVPLPWLVLGVLVYPFVVLLAYVYVRQAEHVERDFAATLDRARADGPVRPAGADVRHPGPSPRDGRRTAP